jgi:protein O-GlcNAc transferase
MGDALQRALQDARDGKLPAALAAMRLVVQRKPRDADALQVLGLLLVQAGQPTQAVHQLQRAVQVTGGAPGARNNLANALAAAGRHDEAIAQWRSALAAEPSYARALLGIVGSCNALGRFEDAIAAAEQGCALKPDWPELAVNHAVALQGADRVEDAVALLRATLVSRPGNTTARSNLLLMLNYLDGPAGPLVAEHVAFGAALDGHPSPPTAATAAGRRLRIGILSGDLRSHSVGFFVQPLVRHAGADVELVAFSTSRGAPDDPMAAWFGAHVPEWVDVAAHDDAALDREIRGRRIDVLIELSGHTAGNRLAALARKPAPVIVSAIGYPNTTGVPAVDVRLVDALTDPVGSEASMTERPLRLDPCFLCYAPPAMDLAPAMPSVEAPFTFGSFNLLSKLREPTIALWKTALDAVPGSRLLLKSKGLDESAVRFRLLRRFESGGIDPSRVELLGAVDGPREHLGLYSRVHVALDPTPYNGTTTTCEALWMGVPVLTLVGDRHAARVGASLLHAVGLPGLACPDHVSFARLAAELAMDPGRLEAWRVGLRAQVESSSLCDGSAWTGRLVSALRALHHAACVRTC